MGGRTQEKIEKRKRIGEHPYSFLPSTLTSLSPCRYWGEDFHTPGKTPAQNLPLGNSVEWTSPPAAE